MKNSITMWRGLILCVLTFSFLAGNAQVPADYYSPAEGKTGEELKSSLHGIIKNHVEYPYTSSSTDVWDILKETDRDPNNPDNVIGIYSDFSMNASQEYNSGDGWNREHVWAKSRGDFGTRLGAGTDVHHLRAADISTNSARNNRTFSEATQVYTDGSGTYQGVTDSYTSSEEFVWEPQAKVKGDIARMIFYMATRYEGFDGDPDLEIVDYIVDASDKSPLHGRLSDLLAWHAADPVDDLEKERNEIIYSYQENRNPYIDHPEYVELIWGEATGATFAITSTPIKEVTAATSYAYNITTSGGESSISFEASQKPSWLTFTDNSDGTAILTGTPAESNTGTYSIDINATDGTTTASQAFTLTVSTQPSSNGYATDLFISEYVEGSSYNKVLEIANFTGTEVDLSTYALHKQTNGSGSWSTGLNLTGSLPDGEVYVIAHTSAASEIIAQADLTSGSSELNFNGNDAVALFKSDDLLDIIGVFNDGANFAKDVSLVRKSSVSSPKLTYDVNEWDTYSKDTFTYLGGHTFDSAVNEAPTVSITSPTDDSAFIEGDVITIEASANDTDGSVSKVVFYEGSNVLGEDDTSPYLLDWSNAAPGSHSLTALVYDNENTSSSSAVVNITVESSSDTPDLFFSEYIEGSSYNKALEIANLTGSDIDLSTYSLHKQTNGSGSWSAGLNLTGILSHGEVYVIAHSSASSEVLEKTDLTSGSSELTFNGNDAVALFKSGDVLDIIGVFNDDTYFAKDVSLVRKSSVSSPKTSYDVGEWDTYPKDTFSYLGAYGTLSTSSINSLKDKLIVYPNPFQNTATIKLNLPQASEVSVNIYTLTGKKIAESFYPAKQYGNDIMLGSDLSRGIYILEVIIDGVPERMKIIKE